jgi:membrane fusion protein, multidrug efflux system
MIKRSRHEKFVISEPGYVKKGICLRNMAKNTIITIVAVLLIGVAGFLLIKPKPATTARRPNATLVRVGIPQRLTVSYTSSLTGDISPIYEANIYSKVTGNLDKVYVNIGDSVRENQLLALIDTTELYQAYEEAAANNDNARILFERTQKLVQQNFAARQDLDNAEAAYKVVKANFDGAQTRLAYAHISAPFAGFITRRYLDPGALVNANTSNLFTLVDIDSVKIFGNILEKNIPLVTTATKALITVDAYQGKQFEGAVSRISGALDTNTRTMPVEIDIPNWKFLLRPGMFGHLTLVLQQHQNALTVPTYTILSDTSGNFIYTISGGTAHRHIVEIGAQQDSITEVISGLQDADTVVTAGQQLLREGAPVSIQKSG